jgi:hypothetical protein
MKTKQVQVFITALAMAVSIFSCSKKENTKETTPVIPPSHPIAAGNISGFLKGTLLAGVTYTVTADVTVKKGDTLAAQPGAIVTVTNNSQFTINGVLQLLGTQASPITFNSDKNTAGTWGGFQCDTALAVTIKWAHILNTGGLDPTASPRKTISVAAPIFVDLEDSWISGGEDDIIAMKSGAKITILRNTFDANGSTDGECINLKTGVTGVVAYNVIFSQAGTAVKLETSDTSPIPQTVVDIFNNTAVDCGWRRGAGEPGRGVSIDLNAKANVYNNIYVNNYEGFEMYAAADVADVHYGNNLYYASVDAFADNTVTPPVNVNIRANFFPTDGVGVAQSTDLVSTGLTSFNPSFKTFSASLVATATGAADPNDYHLQAGSPAIGKGNTSFALYNPSLAGGATPDVDLGAYPTDGKGNKH